VFIRVFFFFGIYWIISDKKRGKKKRTKIMRTMSTGMAHQCC